MDANELARLAERARAGDREALGALLAGLGARALPYAERLTGARERAEDSCQEAFVKVIQGLPRLRDDAAILPWALRIVRNECLLNLRRRGLVSRVESRRAEDEETEGAFVREAPVLAAEALEDRARLAAALAALTPADREVLGLRYEEGLGVEAMAEVLEVTRSAVAKRLLRALRRLRDRMAGAAARTDELAGTEARTP